MRKVRHVLALECQQKHGGAFVLPLYVQQTFPNSSHCPASFFQYQSHSVVRIKCGGFETEEAVDRRRTGDDFSVMVMKSTDGLLVSSELKPDKNDD